MKRVLTLLLILFAAMETLTAQSYTNARHSIILGVGGNVFMGDLGGGGKEGAHVLGVRDIDQMKISTMVAYRYMLTDRLAARLNVVYSQVGAEDVNSEAESRRVRNLNFKSTLFDVGATVEYYFIKEKNLSKQINNQTFAKRWAGYLFTGFSMLHFNPLGEYEGQWYELQPLCTEGQGTGVHYTIVENGTSKVVEAPQPYKLLVPTIPVGFGFKCQIDRQLSIGIEFAQRFTTTDYIDDCSSYYFNYEKNGLTPPAEMTNIFADRRINSNGNTKTGVQRGNPGYNDSYFTAMATVYYKFGGFNSARR